LKYPFPFSVSYVQLVIQQYKPRTVEVKNTSVIKVATMKNTDDFHYAKEAIMCNNQIIAFHCQQDEWNTKEDTGKSLNNTLHKLPYAKRHLSG